MLYSATFPAGFGNWWDGQLTEETGFYNVALDLHNYDCYGNSSSKSVEEHLAQAVVWREQIRALQTYRPVMVGEFSLAAGAHSPGQPWASAQVDAFSYGLGWFFWSLILEGDDSGGDTWSLRGVLQSGIELKSGRSVEPPHQQVTDLTRLTALSTARLHPQLPLTPIWAATTFAVLALAASPLLWLWRRRQMRAARWHDEQVERVYVAFS